MHDLIKNNVPHKCIDYFSFLDHPYETRNIKTCNISIIKIKEKTLENNLFYITTTFVEQSTDNFKEKYFVCVIHYFWD